MSSSPLIGQTFGRLTVLRLLKDDGWVAWRAPASLGVADVIALRAGSRSRP